jgi:hypothetical protein
LHSYHVEEQEVQTRRVRRQARHEKVAQDGDREQGVHSWIYLTN